VITDVNSEDRLVQATFAEHLERVLRWRTVYAFNTETFGANGTLGRTSEREVVLTRDLRTALAKLNANVPAEAREEAVRILTTIDPSRSVLQHNREFHRFVRNGVPVKWMVDGEEKHARVRVIDFRDPENNNFLAVRELKVQGVTAPHYNRRADLVCFVNGLPLVVIELKAIYRNIRAGFDDNLTDYLHPSSISHLFHHNAFLVVSNGDKARYGSLTSQWEHFLEWKRNEESDAARLDAQVLLDGMLAKDRLLDIVENFVLFDDSRAGGVRKVVARNQQVLGVNLAVASVVRQEELKRQFPRDERLTVRAASRAAEAASAWRGPTLAKSVELLPIVERAHPELGRLGVFWHTQGSGKSYSMVFFAEKVRRVVPGNFTFVVATDREDLDDQIHRTFIGCAAADEKSPRASSGPRLRELLAENHRYVFSLIHKFNQPVTHPYTERDDIIVISDEAHRTQTGKFARNMRLALPNASFIGFTGTPLFKHDHLTKRIFGGYISRYDFKRSQEDGSTVRLVYENRGEKLGLARLDLNDRIAEAIEEADLDTDQEALLERLLGKDYEVITADDRLDKLADDFVEHCTRRWEAGKSMLVCIDKITCARMLQRIEPRWKNKITASEELVDARRTELASLTEPEQRERVAVEIERLDRQVAWMRETIVEILISEGQNEVEQFKKWGVDIIPHRVVMKTGFETPDGRRVAVEDAFKDPAHPFRVAIVCAMWLTGFDVECLSTLYIDKPMKAHNLMQAIARANRVYPGKECGLIVDYNGMLKSLRAALAQYALGDDGAGGDGAIVAPIDELLVALRDAIEAAEAHVLSLGFDVRTLVGSTGFQRIQGLKASVDALYTTDEAKRRFEIIARQVFVRFKALVTEPSAYTFAERHDNIAAIYKKLEERRDTADVTDVLKALHRIVNEAIRAQEPGVDHAEGLTVDLSTIDFDKLRAEFASKVKHKRAALGDIRELVEAKLAKMLDVDPLRMDFYRKYQEIVADYNREKDRATVEATFAKLVELANGLDTEQRRAAEEGLSDTEMALFKLLFRESITKAERERLKQASKSLLASLKECLATMQDWTRNASTQAEVKVRILDALWTDLPRPPFTEAETEEIADRVYDYVWQRSATGSGWMVA
jgi:type I restriction enzyme R subunit